MTLQLIRGHTSVNQRNLVLSSRTNQWECVAWQQTPAGRSIIRIAEILNCFSVEEPVHNLTAISRRLGLPKSTSHRLLTTLVSQGFLMRDVHGRGYQLGYQLLHWGMVAQAALDLHSEALPIMPAALSFGG